MADSGKIGLPYFYTDKGTSYLDSLKYRNAQCGYVAHFDLVVVLKPTLAVFIILV